MLENRPQLPNEFEQLRAEHQALRTRMLGGRWDKDLEKIIGAHISEDRRSTWGIPDGSRNPFKAIAQQIGGVLYLSPPAIIPPDDSGEALLKIVRDAGYWSLAQRVSTDLVGLREIPVRLDYTERGGMIYKPIPPDLTVIRDTPDAPGVPAFYMELQTRTRPGAKEQEWVWEILDITDLDNPSHVIMDADREEDLTAIYMGKEMSGDDYQYRDSSGKAYLPVVLYHAETTGRIWDSWYGIETVKGSLTVGVLLTFWVHGIRDGSFATVLLVNGRVVGAEITNSEGMVTQVISAEPGALMEVAIQDEGIQPQVVQLKPGMDPEKTMTAIGMYEAGLSSYAGVSAADILRTGADPRSGISLSISREGLRDAQKRMAPQLSRSDAELVSKSAMMVNRATGTSYPETGYTVTYPSLPLSAAETTALRDDLIIKIEQGLMSKIDAYRILNPGVDRAQAILALKKIMTDNAALSAPPALV